MSSHLEAVEDHHIRPWLVRTHIIIGASLRRHCMNEHKTQLQQCTTHSRSNINRLFNQLIIFTLHRLLCVHYDKSATQGVNQIIDTQIPSIIDQAASGAHSSAEMSSPEWVGCVRWICRPSIHSDASGAISVLLMHWL